MNHATRLLVSVFGVLAGIAGIEHGIGEVLQGNTAPDSVFILSWPDSPFFDVLAGEPAMTIIPNLLVSGILGIVIAAIFTGWAARRTQRRNCGVVMIALSLVLLLVGGGFGPPLLGVILGLTATRIHAPLTWWRDGLSAGTRQFLAALWPWAFGVTLVAWLVLFVGVSLYDTLVGVDDPYIVNTVGLVAFGGLFATILLGFVRDADRRADTPPEPITRRAPSGHA